MSTKLSIVVMTSSCGMKVVHKSNNELTEDWIRHVDDIAECKWFNFSEYLLVLKNIESGHLIGVVFPFKGGRNESWFAYIYVPKNIRIKGEDLETLINKVSHNLKDGNCDKVLFDDMFGDEYPIYDIERTINISDKKKSLACRKYGDLFNLQELLDGLNQTYYSDYKYIFFIDKNTSFNNDVINLTSEPIKKEIVIKHLEKKGDFVPYYNNNKFEKDIILESDTKITIVWKNEKDDRYIDITKSVKVSENFEDKLYPNQNDYKLTINKDCVKVVDKDKIDSSIKEYKLLINGKSVESSYVFSENGLNEANIIVNAEGYEKYEKKHNLKDNKQITIKLEKKLIKYSYTIGGVEFTAKTKNKISNIEGVEVKYNKIKEEYTVSPIKPKLSSNKKLAIAFVIGLVLGFGATATYYFMNKKIAKPTEKETRKTINEFPQNADSSESKETIPPQDNSDECAIDYLNNHNEWKKSEMENIPELKGLWDALVGYKSKDILDFENTLKESDKFKQILAKIDAIKDKNEKFSAENETIVFNDYMNSLNKPSTPQQAENGNPNKNSITGKENKQGKNQQPDRML